MEDRGELDNEFLDEQISKKILMKKFFFCDWSHEAKVGGAMQLATHMPVGHNLSCLKGGCEGVCLLHRCI